MTDRADNIRKLKSAIPEKKKRKYLRMFSIKRARINRGYKTIADIFLATHQRCQIGAPGCTGRATEIHHKKGRIGKLLTDVRYFMASCRSCNSYVEIHDAWARKKGFKISKFS